MYVWWSCFMFNFAFIAHNTHCYCIQRGNDHLWILAFSIDCSYLGTVVKGFDLLHYWLSSRSTLTCLCHPDLSVLVLGESPDIVSRWPALKHHPMAVVLWESQGMFTLFSWRVRPNLCTGVRCIETIGGNTWLFAGVESFFQFIV